MLYPPGFYHVKKHKRFVILSSDKSSERNLSCFFDIIKPRRIEHLQNQEPISSDPYFRTVIVEIFAEEQNFAVLSCACQNNGTLVGSKVVLALFLFLKENSFYIHKFSQDFSHQHTNNTCSKCWFQVHWRSSSKFRYNRINNIPWWQRNQRYKGTKYLIAKQKKAIKDKVTKK